MTPSNPISSKAINTTKFSELHFHTHPDRTALIGEAPTESTSERVPPFRGFCSPQSLEAINLNFDPQFDEENNDTKYKNTAYSEKECEHLIRCWTDISIDSIVGNDQRIDQMWERITKAYNNGRSPERNCRDIVFLEMWPSGASEADIIKKAQDEYIETHGTRGFRHIGVWNLLKECPKFTHQDVRATKKGKSSASGAYTSASTDDNGDETTRTRPIGAKEVVDALNARAVATTMMAKAMADKQKAKEHKILMQDTSKMSETQLRFHLKYCAQIQKKWEAEE
ncbi:hypothetical protein OROMI_016894 [Orobanche minor]